MNCPQRSTQRSCLEEYNPETKKTKVLKSFDFNDKTNTGEAIRQITSDESTISLLMLKMQTEDNVWLRIDIYDHDMKFLRSVDLSTICSDKNELRQGVAPFVVSNNYVYYENFSTTRFWGKIEGNTVSSVMETNPDFGMASKIVKNNDETLFFQSFSSGNNYLYLLNSKNGTIKKATFNADDVRYWIVNASRDTNNKLLITMSYKDLKTAEKLAPKLYYISLSDLKFIDLGETIGYVNNFVYSLPLNKQLTN